MGRPRLVDVAREAGVGIGTASNALSGKNRIPESTRQRVRDAAERLGYVPNAIARAMTVGRLPLLGFVIGSLRRPGEFEIYRKYWADVIAAGSLAATDRGYGLVVLPGVTDLDFTAIPLAGLVIIDTVADDPDLARALPMGVPVLTDAWVTDPRVAVRLRVDYDRTVPAVMDHFLASGARAPGLLWTDVNTSFSTGLLAAQRTWSEAHGLPLRVADIDAEHGGTVAAVERLLDGGADAIYAAVPVVTEILAVVAARGLVIGRDVRLVVLEDDTDERLADRGISTVWFSVAALSESAVAAMIEVIQGRLSTPTELPCDFALFPRASSMGAAVA